MNSRIIDAQLIERYEALRKQMQSRVDELAKSYEQFQPLNQFLAVFHDDPELEKLDQELCELEALLPDSYEYESEYIVSSSSRLC